MNELVISVLLLAYIGVKEWLHTKERKHMINAIMSKDAEQLRDLEIVDKTKVNVKPAPKDETPDLVPLDSVSDDEFFESIGLPKPKE